VVWAETKRVEAIGRRHLEAWAVRNGYQGIGCEIHDCGYYAGRSWRGLKAMAFFNIAIRDGHRMYHYGFASCVLSTGDVTIHWAPI
jgi:hypothetical protein